MASASRISESEFAMWRAVFAFALVDNSLSLEEQWLLKVYLNSVPFSQTQLETIKNDFLRPQDVEKMYNAITSEAHKERFCALARAIAWCEGDMDRQEELILKRVACLGHGPDAEIFARTRGQQNLHEFHQHYARAGVAGLMKTSAGFQMQA